MTQAQRPSVFDYAGGYQAWLNFAGALHERCLADPVLNHPFSHSLDPQHIDHLAHYLGEVFGGPATYTQTCGGHSAMLRLHAGSEAERDLAPRFVDCFVAAADDAALPDDPEFRQVLRDYITYATGEVDSYSPRGSVVAPNLGFPRWSWDGLEPPRP
ncbi:MAG: oxidoreductase [Acidimicrobiales bacterium]|jgi:hemoglobin